MIRRVDALTFNARKMQLVSKHTKQPCNVKRGLKAASIYALSTIAAYGILSACTSGKKSAADTVQTPIEQTVLTQEKPKETFKSQLAPNGYYTVKKGDNIWNIAEALLKEKYGENITSVQIYNKELRIMRLNNLKFPSEYSDKVIIHENDLLCVDEHTRIHENVKDMDLSQYTGLIANILYSTCVNSWK